MGGKYVKGETGRFLKGVSENEWIDWYTIAYADLVRRFRIILLPVYYGRPRLETEITIMPEAVCHKTSGRHQDCALR